MFINPLDFKPLMNVPPVIQPRIQPRPPSSRRQLWWWALGLIPIVLVMFVFVNVISYFRLGRDARALRNAVMDVAPAGSALRMEFAVGPGTIGLARWGTSFLDLDEDARKALEVVSSAEVGIYRMEGSCGKEKRAAILAGADQAMAKRGWDRAVGVIHDGKVVAVYLPEDLGKRGYLRLCVLTVTEHEMVIAGAGGRIEPLVELARRHLPDQAELAHWRP